MSITYMEATQNYTHKSSHTHKQNNILKSVFTVDNNGEWCNNYDRRQELGHVWLSFLKQLIDLLASHKL
uniref:Uncharacterized protein n=1 Tax=Helianthus annuus TaxID=4232 RepID=A0A251UN21_HELAN